MGPLSALRRVRPSLSIKVAEWPIEWVSMAMADAILIQRPHRPDQLSIAMMAKKHGIPLWVEHDDNIFSLPADNPAFDTFMRPEVHQVVAKILRMADVVTFSTIALAERMGQFVKGKAFLVPNALMTNMVGHIPDHEGKKRMDAVMWRGSITHQRDLDSHTLSMVELSKLFPEMSWIFQGLSPANYRILELLPRSQRGQSLDPLDYFGVLSATRPKIMMVPLVDNEFNRSKSNIAYIEAIYAGAICVAPDMPEWQRPGCVTYTDQRDFVGKMSWAMSMPAEEQNALWRAGRQHVEQHMTIETANHIRSAAIDHLESLAGNQRWRDQQRTTLYSALEPAQ